MTDRRSYGDPCGIARALDLVGERWALLVVRELVLGPKRFTDLRDGLPGLSPDVLTERLRDLEQAGIVRRRTLAPPAGSRVYELTGWGRELEPVLVALGRWGSRIALGRWGGRGGGGGGGAPARRGGAGRGANLSQSGPPRRSPAAVGGGGPRPGGGLGGRGAPRVRGGAPHPAASSPPCRPARS